ncbi:aminopeptidase P family N-terminal domain-containing protein, partial [Chloroflexota bacterium]
MSIKQYGKVRWGTEAIDWQERVNMPRMREERAARTRTKMKEYGFAVMILTSGTNRRYATAIHASTMAETVPGSSGLTLVFAEENTEDMIDYSLEGNLTKHAKIHCPWLKPENIRTCYSMEPSMGSEAVTEFAKKQAKDIVQVLKEKGLVKEQVAYDALSPALLAALENEGSILTAAPKLMVEARVIKTQDEINCMRMGG